MELNHFNEQLLGGLMNSKRSITVQLIDGSKERGRLTNYNKNFLIIKRPTACHQIQLSLIAEVKKSY